MQADTAANRQEWVVFDLTTANQLGEFATEEEALAYIEEIRPLGRFGPDGHELVAERLTP